MQELLHKEADEDDLGAICDSVRDLKFEVRCTPRRAVTLALHAVRAVVWAADGAAACKCAVVWLRMSSCLCLWPLWHREEAAEAVPQPGRRIAGGNAGD